MDRTFDRALAEAIEEIRSERSSIIEVLARPEARDPEFASLLKLAVSIKPVEGLEPSIGTKRVLRTRLMSEIARETERQRMTLTVRSWIVRSWHHWTRLLAANRLVTSAVALLVVLGLTAGGTVYASQDSLPGDALYGLKLAAEQIQISVARSPEAKIEALLDTAQKRTQEMAEAGNRKSTDVEVLAERYESDINQALQTLGAVDKSDGNRERMVERLLEDLEQHEVRLQQVYENAPTQAKDAVLRARETSRHGLETAAGAAAGHQTSRESAPKDKPHQTTNPTDTARTKDPGPPPDKDSTRTSPMAKDPMAMPSMTPGSLMPPLPSVTPTVPIPAIAPISSSSPSSPMPSATPVRSITPVPTPTPGKAEPDDSARGKKSTRGARPTDVPSKPGPQQTPGPSFKVHEREGKETSTKKDEGPPYGR